MDNLEKHAKMLMDSSMSSIEYNIQDWADEIDDLKKQAKIYLDKIPNAKFRKKVWERAKELKLSALNKRSSLAKVKKS